jgi:hypothetical protein
MKLVGLIKMCLNETYNKVHTLKRICNTFCILNDMKLLLLKSLCFKFTLEHNNTRSRQSSGTEINLDT